MKMTHPITGKVYQDATAYVDALIEAWRKVQIRKHQVGIAEAAVVAAIDEAAGEYDLPSVRLRGEVEEVRVARRENVRYVKPRGARHPLSTLLNLYPEELLPLIRVDYKESGDKLRKLLQRVADGKGTERENEVAAELVKVRETSPGKPRIEVSPRADYDGETLPGRVDLPPMEW